MMQITGKSVPRRGPTLLLALILGAGLALSGCGDDDSTTTPAPAPAPAPAPPAAPDPVGVPGGLTATGGVGFIEFSWEAVEGATGYEVQMTMTEGDFTEVVTAMVEATMHRFSDVAPETTGYGRVRAHEGDRQSDWSETAMGMTMAAPLVLGMPMPKVSSTGPDHIEWSWEPIADALTYQVQTADSMDGFMDSMDPAVIAGQLQTATTYRAEVDPETTMYIRVRAGAGTPTAPIAGEWSAAVMGTSEVAPIPFTVSMTPPEAGADKDCMGQAFCPDGNSDPKKAMASVNKMMMVTASRDTQVTPMFVDGAPAVTASAGGDTPFMHSDFMAMQTMVAGDGVSFMLRPVTVGAGQEPMPMGDAMYITCGPFRCSEASDETPAAPEITLADSEVCENFEVDLTLVKGAALNGYYNNDASGVDVGWVYTASHAARVTHEFTNVTAGTVSMTVPGTSLAATSTPRALSMTAASETSSSRVNKFGAFANRDGDAEGQTVSRAPDALTQSDPGPIRNGPNDCMPVGQTGHDNNNSRGGWSYYAILRNDGNVRNEIRPVRKPEHCFRLITDGLYTNPPHNEKVDVTFYNYVPGYSVHVDPVGGVSWAGSSVTDWGDGHPFDELKCPRVTFAVEDQLDVCADFQEEVDAYWGAGIGSGGAFQVQFDFGAGTSNTDGRLNNIVIRNRGTVSSATQNTAGLEYRPDGSRHANMWLADGRAGENSNTGIDGKRRNANMYWLLPDNQHAKSGTVWTPIMTLKMTDDDGDPAYGDFGKIDMDSTAGVAENMTGGGVTGQLDHAQCSNADGPGCDATMSFDLSATFTRIANTDSCTRTVEQSITCTWDADGDNKRKGATTFDTHASQNTFISCQAAN